MARVANIRFGYESRVAGGSPGAFCWGWVLGKGLALTAGAGMCYNGGCHCPMGHLNNRIATGSKDVCLSGDTLVAYRPRQGLLLSESLILAQDERWRRA